MPFSACLILALAFAAPASAQRMSTADRLTALEQQLTAMRSGNLDLLNQVGELKTEVQALRAQIEELQQQLELEKQSGRNQALDFDDRLNRLEKAAAQSVSAPSLPSMPATPTASPNATIPAPTGAAAPAVQEASPRVYGDASTLGKGMDERGAYSAAFDALKAGRYAESARAFQTFLDSYPSGVFAPNAMYWLGESYYVTQNYALALEQFQALLNQYPTHDKAAGALLKVGLCQYGLRQLDAAEATLSRVVARYPGTEAARTADDRLRAIQLSRVR
ncbi:tol-pal system protein YbgF [Lysobacter hankyongensis]|uniref:Cell division coordinator CpoB n=2 Tax=Lysobacter hankyongensis TaxID=1176535 RepID=A0ABP9BD85_9GAMM